jgi:hypothetical protein
MRNWMKATASEREAHNAARRCRRAKARAGCPSRATKGDAIWSYIVQHPVAKLKDIVLATGASLRMVQLVRSEMVNAGLVDPLR